MIEFACSAAKAAPQLTRTSGRSRASSAPRRLKLQLRHLALMGMVALMFASSKADADVGANQAQYPDPILGCVIVHSKLTNEEGGAASPYNFFLEAKTRTGDCQSNPFGILFMPMTVRYTLWKYDFQTGKPFVCEERLNHAIEIAEARIAGIRYGCGGNGYYNLMVAGGVIGDTHVEFAPVSSGWVYFNVWEAPVPN